MENKVLWCFYDPQSKMKTEAMTSDQAQLAIMKMKSKDIKNLFVWRSDWPTWKKLSDFIQSNDSPFSAMTNLMNSPSQDKSQSGPIKMKPADLKTQKEVERTISMAEKSLYEIVLMNKKGNIYRSKTSKFDMAICEVKGPIPDDFFYEEIEVVLINKSTEQDRKIKISAKVENATNLKFIIKTEQDKQSLKSFLPFVLKKDIIKAS